MEWSYLPWYGITIFRFCLTKTKKYTYLRFERTNELQGMTEKHEIDNHFRCKWWWPSGWQSYHTLSQNIPHQIQREAIKPSINGQSFYSKRSMLHHNDNNFHCLHAINDVQVCEHDGSIVVGNCMKAG